MKMLIDLDHLPEPGTPMKIRVSRRGLLSAAADAAEERRRRLNGAQSHRIEELADWPDEALAELFPAVNSRAKIGLSDGVVFAETSAAVDPIPLFRTDSPALFIFNQFNGRQTMGQVIGNVSEHTGWDEEQSRRMVRAVFLKLCEVRVCEPRNSD